MYHVCRDVFVLWYTQTRIHIVLCVGVFVSIVALTMTSARTFMLTTCVTHGQLVCMMTQWL